MVPSRCDSLSLHHAAAMAVSASGVDDGKGSCGILTQKPVTQALSLVVRGPVAADIVDEFVRPVRTRVGKLRRPVRDAGQPGSTRLGAP